MAQYLHWATNFDQNSYIGIESHHITFELLGKFEGNWFAHLTKHFLSIWSNTETHSFV